MRCRALTKDNHIIWFGKKRMLNYVITIKDSPTSSTTTRGQVNVPSENPTVINGINVRLDPFSTSFKTGDSGKLYDSKGNETGTYEIVYVNTEDYVSDTDAVVASLIQRLSVIKGELWYQINYGLPLTESVSSAALFDSVIADIITSHPGVAALDSYKSWISGHTYYYTCKITSIFAESFEISNNFEV